MRPFGNHFVSSTQSVEILQTETETIDNSNEKRVGLLGGTFNPVHNGHLIIAEQVYDALKLDRVYFVPDYQPPHVDHKDTIDPHYRLEMLGLALINNSHFGIETVDLERGGKSYAVETMKILTKRHPDVQYYFIIGADMVEYLPKWYQIDELVKMVQFVGVKRPGYKLETKYPIIEVDVPEIDISSTTIREKVAKGESIRYLVPDPVYQYILEKGLYLEN